MEAAGWVAVVVIGVIIGWLVHTYGTRGTYPGGIWGAMIAGLIGSYLGAVFLGEWGWMLGNANVIAAVAGSAVLSFVAGLFGREART